jgi:hypothetical protein
MFHSTADDLIKDGLYSEIAVPLYNTPAELRVARGLVIKSVNKGKMASKYLSRSGRRQLRNLTHAWGRRLSKSMRSSDEAEEGVRSVRELTLERDMRV